MYTRLWKLITKHMEENSRMAVFLTSAMLIFGLFGGGCFLWNHRNHLYKQ